MARGRQEEELMAATGGFIDAQSVAAMVLTIQVVVCMRAAVLVWAAYRERFSVAVLCVEVASEFGMAGCMLGFVSWSMPEEIFDGMSKNERGKPAAVSSYPLTDPPADSARPECSRQHALQDLFNLTP
jgi:hypothetical protein